MANPWDPEDEEAARSFHQGKGVALSRERAQVAGPKLKRPPYKPGHEDPSEFAIDPEHPDLEGDGTDGGMAAAQNAAMLKALMNMLGNSRLTGIPEGPFPPVENPQALMQPQLPHALGNAIDGYQGPGEPEGYPKAPLRKTKRVRGKKEVGDQED